jgi:hypothetical protein
LYASSPEKKFKLDCGSPKHTTACSLLKYKCPTFSADGDPTSFMAPEHWLLIFSYLLPDEICQSAMRLNKNMAGLAQSDYLWRPLTYRIYQDWCTNRRGELLRPRLCTSWKQIYRDITALATAPRDMTALCPFCGDTLPKYGADRCGFVVAPQSCAFCQVKLTSQPQPCSACQLNSCDTCQITCRCCASRSCPQCAVKTRECQHHDTCQVTSTLHCHVCTRSCDRCAMVTCLSAQKWCKGCIDFLGCAPCLAVHEQDCLHGVSSDDSNAAFDRCHICRTHSTDSGTCHKCRYTTCAVCLIACAQCGTSCSECCQCLA